MDFSPGAGLSLPVQVMRIRAHEAFDPLWQSGHMSRSKAYDWLSQQMGLAPDECHMKMMTAEQCERVIEICEMALLKADRSVCSVGHSRQQSGLVP